MRCGEKITSPEGRAREGQWGPLSPHPQGAAGPAEHQPQHRHRRGPDQLQLAEVLDQGTVLFWQLGEERRGGGGSFWVCHGSTELESWQEAEERNGGLTSHLLPGLENSDYCGTLKQSQGWHSWGNRGREAARELGTLLPGTGRVSINSHWWYWRHLQGDQYQLVLVSPSRDLFPHLRCVLGRQDRRQPHCWARSIPLGWVCLVPGREQEGRAPAGGTGPFRAPL